jgi:tol-pal system protein YbgF
MRVAILICTSISLAGCATAGQTAPDTENGASADGAQPESAMQTLQRETEDQARRIAELEARLTLLEKESRDYRESGAMKPSETVRIGGGSSASSGPRASASSNDDASEPEPREARRGRVPVVRLHERDPEPAFDAGEGDAPVLLLPDPPPGVASKLGVVPLPQERASKALSGEPLPSSARDKATVEQYRTALRLLREQRWVEAHDGFDEFLRLHSDHELAANATYWRGESDYAQRRYAQAQADFQEVVVRFARSEKAADALLKLGMCQRRLGDNVAAERSFRQLREQYPSSDAARVASRENPS